MQATDLLMGLLINSKVASQDLFSLKSENLQSATGMNAFQSLFEKALNQPVAKSDGNNLTNNQSSGEKSNVAANNVKSGAQSGERQSGSQRVAKREAAASSAETQQTDSQETAGSSQQTVAETDQSDDAQSTVDKLNAIVDKIEEEIEKGEGGSDEQLMALLLQLMALLLSEMKQDTVAAAGGESNSQDLSIAGEIGALGETENLDLTVNLDPNSKIAKIVQMLLNGNEELTQEDLENVDILIKLADNKGLLIPLSELGLGAASDENSESNQIILQTADSEDGEQLKLTLTISAESMKSAELVDLSDTALEQTDIAMIVPAELLVAEDETQIEAKNLLEELALMNANSEVVQALKEEGNSTEAADEGKVVLPLKTATEDTKQASSEATAKPVITTSDPMYLTSDKYLKSMQAEALAKEMSAKNSDKQEVFDRIQQLFSSDESGAKLFAKIMESKQASSFNFMGETAQNFGEQQAGTQQTGDFTAEMASADSTQQAQTTGATADVTADRVAFLGRTVSSASTAEVMAQRTDNASSTAQGQNFRESVMQQIISRAAYTFQNGTEGEVRIFLRPENLGDLHLKVKIEQDVVTAKFTAQSQEVKAIIENNLGQLKQALDEMGIKVGKFQVNVDNGSGQQPQQAQQDGQGGGSFGNSHAAGDAADNYGAVSEYDFDDVALYGSNGMVGAGAASVNYLA